MTLQLHAKDAYIQEQHAREISLQQNIQDLSLVRARRTYPSGPTSNPRRPAPGPELTRDLACQAKIGLEGQLHQLKNEDKHSALLQLRYGQLG